MWEGYVAQVVSESSRLKFMTSLFPRSFLLLFLHFWGSKSVSFCYSYVTDILAFPVLCSKTTEVWLIRDDFSFIRPLLIYDYAHHILTHALASDRINIIIILQKQQTTLTRFGGKLYKTSVILNRGLWGAWMVNVKVNKK